MKARLTFTEQADLEALLDRAKGHTAVLNEIERLIAVTLGLEHDPTGVITDAVTAGWSLETLLHELDIPQEPSEADA